MDPSVLEAIARWPDVPAVAGWLSLDAQGRWKLHPQGDAAQGGPGVSIANTAILAFMDRNYGHDDQGRWFFQNGPQRVYVRLDAAPYILRTGADASVLETHTGQSVGDVAAWYLDDAHQLYARTDLGPGMVAGRDVAVLMDAMRLEDGGDALEAAATLEEGAVLRVCHPASKACVPLTRVPRVSLPRELGFVGNPGVPAKPVESAS
ncbi:hypothetical protein CAL26_04925 [Bordetella genomosp. 9]|uniref:DUF2946 domain-containing protein n=1 Tax=Bordetella genomosp. 9 TaxID=1416803 RepID=A0A261RPG0_9BORD|nr:DUF2946 family protein [Bordetella genomosp. 9]OZI26667.1 hypothetical protein CAL26_04925 [Bordetella genomosp. 9]